MTIGRPNKGLGHVASLEGGAAEKRRLRAILATLSGDLSVQDACAELGIGRARFSELRRLALQAACDALCPGSPGRPRCRDVDMEDELGAWKTRCDELESELVRARLQVELAIAMPQHVARVEKKGAVSKQQRRGGSSV